MRQHRHHPICHIRRTAALQCFFVQRRILFDIVLYIRNGYLQEPAISIFDNTDSVIKVLGIITIDCDRNIIAQIHSACHLFFGYFLRNLINLCHDFIRESRLNVMVEKNRKDIHTRIILMTDGPVNPHPQIAVAIFHNGSLNLQAFNDVELVGTFYLEHLVLQFAVIQHKFWLIGTLIRTNHLDMGTLQNLDDMAICLTRTCLIGNHIAIERIQLITGVKAHRCAIFFVDKAKSLGIDTKCAGIQIDNRCQIPCAIDVMDNLTLVFHLVQCCADRGEIAPFAKVKPSHNRPGIKTALFAIC